jgi:hypothetical protein
VELAGGGVTDLPGGRAVAVEVEELRLLGHPPLGHNHSAGILLALTTLMDKSNQAVDGLSIKRTSLALESSPANGVGILVTPSFERLKHNEERGNL